jgi:hypothetical protein
MSRCEKCGYFVPESEINYEGCEGCNPSSPAPIRIFNGTPHSINIISNSNFDSAIRKFTTKDPKITISIPSNGMLNAKINTVDADSVNSIPVFSKAIDSCDLLPDGYDIYIVSALFSNAYTKVFGNTDGLYTVADPVYSIDGRTILGSRGICPAF